MDRKAEECGLVSILEVMFNHVHSLSWRVSVDNYLSMYGVLCGRTRHQTICCITHLHNPGSSEGRPVTSDSAGREELAVYNADLIDHIEHRTWGSCLRAVRNCGSCQWCILEPGLGEHTVTSVLESTLTQYEGQLLDTDRTMGSPTYVIFIFKLASNTKFQVAGICDLVMPFCRRSIVISCGNFPLFFLSFYGVQLSSSTSILIIVLRGLVSPFACT